MGGRQAVHSDRCDVRRWHLSLGGNPGLSLAGDRDIRQLTEVRPPIAAGDLYVRKGSSFSKYRRDIQARE